MDFKKKKISSNLLTFSYLLFIDGDVPCLEGIMQLVFSELTENK